MSDPEQDLTEEDLAAKADAAGRIGADLAFAAASRGRLVLVDIRTPAEWAQTGVPAGAALVCLTSGPGRIRTEFVAEIEALLGGDRGRPVALVCRTGGRTAFARQLLIARGFARVFDVAEGMIGSSFGPGWLARGLPIEAWPGARGAEPPVTGRSS
ncbi:MAG: rhodanese-like domain-containing protein [Geminicoccaceae bacterium]|nr:rhodanese-like domain-containing protein [Geminicoccaceae bacterium]MCS7268715.1 rhodanese-like domain-containing protein [Geminicoccaceae bacterium]MCX7629081.1 rhodanese-like domain-containing protein [Geminicoccaceae bacterium]MDW8125566.1 rhodanese-like domain-containing protein [Geminicoccaceae bacterium]MDW8342211.1 rhodanese-like domain-containing protein [Geminicoccaceae bacterium]